MQRPEDEVAPQALWEVNDLFLRGGKVAAATLIRP